MDLHVKLFIATKKKKKIQRAEEDKKKFKNDLVCCEWTSWYFWEGVRGISVSLFKKRKFVERRRFSPEMESYYLMQRNNINSLLTWMMLSPVQIKVKRKKSDPALWRLFSHSPNKVAILSRFVQWRSQREHSI